jgi:putative inorganic carbon (HCO3(-)) transporter
VITIPLQNRDIFSVVFSRIYPVRLVIILIILFGALSLISWLLREKDKRSSIVRVYRWVSEDMVLKVLLILFLVRTVSIKNSLNLSASISLLLFYLSMVALYVVLRFVCEKEPSFLKTLFKLYLVTVSLVALFGLLQLVLSFFGMRLPGVLVGSTFVRIPSTFYDANHLPPYLLTAFPAIFIFLFYVKKEHEKLLLGVLLSVFALVLLFTFSRSGFLSFSVAMLILSFTFIKRHYWQKVLTVFSVFLFAMVIIFLTSQTQLSIFKRLSSVFNIEDKSTVAHGLLAYGGIELLKQSPIIGLGYGSFSEYFRKSSVGQEHAVFDPATEVRIPVHSIWLEVIVETGLMGFTFYLWFMLSVLEKSWFHLREQKIKKNYLIQLALLSSMVGILVSGLFYSYNLEFFWFFIFILHFQSVKGSELGLYGRQSDSDPEEEQVPWKFLMLIVLVVVVGSSLMIYGLNRVPILPGQEGIIAVAGRDMRAHWGYNANLWWAPAYAGKFLPLPPLPIWLNAFWTYLFDFGTWVPRFLPAVFSVMGILVFFILSLVVTATLEAAFFSVLLVLASPLFLSSARFGNNYGLVFLCSSLIILLVKGSVEGRRYLLIPLFVTLLLLSLITYEGYFLLGSVVLGFYGCWGLLKDKKWLLLVPALICTSAPVVTWWLVLHRLARFGLGDYVKFLGTDALLVYYFLFLPLLVLLVVRLFSYKYRFLASLVLLVVIIFSFYRSSMVPGNADEIKLISVRMGINRDGRTPLYILRTPSSDLLYYSPAPLIRVSINELRERFRSDRLFFAIADGDTLKSIKARDGFGFTSVAVSNNLVLIERPGRIE